MNKTKDKHKREKKKLRKKGVGGGNLIYDFIHHIKIRKIQKYFCGKEKKKDNFIIIIIIFNFLSSI